MPNDATTASATYSSNANASQSVGLAGSSSSTPIQSQSNPVTPAQELTASLQNPINVITQPQITTNLPSITITRIIEDVNGQYIATYVQELGCRILAWTGQDYLTNSPTYTNSQLLTQVQNLIASGTYVKA